MRSEIIQWDGYSFGNVKAANGTPSLEAAVRASAETLVKLAVENNLDMSEGCLCKYLLGDVEADFIKGSDSYLVAFYRGSPSLRTIAKVRVFL